jgi:hypothetical protein
MSELNLPNWLGNVPINRFSPRSLEEKLVSEQHEGEKLLLTAK